jgi:hypothetical protein
METTGKASTRKWVAVIVLIVVLMSGLLLSLAVMIPNAHRFALTVQQKAQFHSMEAAIALFQIEFGSYPPSDANDPEGKSYCGAMKLCEAILGRDLLGMHPNTAYRQDGTDGNGNAVYQPTSENIKARMGPYLPLDNTNAQMLKDIYGAGNTPQLPETLYVQCDVFERKQRSGAKTGMPILYYLADPNGTAHDADFPDNPANIYDYRDNQAILELGVPGKPGVKHPLADPKVFYEVIRNHRSESPPIPYKPNSYILISAGKDALYGTSDDVFNFDWKPPPRR